MKAIFHVIVILAIGGATYFSLEHSRKFELTQTERLEAIRTNVTVTANAEGTESQLKKETGTLSERQDAREVLRQSIEATQSSAGTVKKELVQLDEQVKTQEVELADLESKIKEFDAILTNLGMEVDPDNLQQSIDEVEEQQKQRLAKLEELETLVKAAEKRRAENKAEMERLVKRDMERSARIALNSMESVITAVNQDWGFVVIGAGSNSGFSPQTPLIVQRNGRMIGRVNPSKVEATQTIAEIDFNSLATGVRIQRGDRVILASPLTN